MDEFERAVNAGPGEPAKEAVEGALEEASRRLGVLGDMYEWTPGPAEVEGLDGDDEVEAWIICRARAQVIKKAGARRRREREERAATGSDDGAAGAEGRDRDSLMRQPDEEERGRTGIHEERWEVIQDRKIPKCMGEWA